ncbi:tRNA (adenosine(37)-N6)-threonylcarbamoyltransferase complex dimerization subunit type 1 TsaB [Candidatus Saccharibacteria bacterium]|nr:tRNA (adenosine(37)-N6)-threonylcarbamoyltransferase complex dimerization subunit type 1 TsaB [Candidatus Saccharibacteria bacterium]NCU40589.1 tRNA (adenosine(37)-N6)-threonylcarbamoyltransferase complex dimerization subunit type 1 TsaB [Candidatus Saccharibacteria bacterium]
MLFGLKTDSSIAELYLYDLVGNLVAEYSWEANRSLARELLSKIDEFLAQNNVAIEQIKGLFAYKGPGSFTGLRIGLTVINTLSYAHSLPVASGEDEDWCKEAVESLLSGVNQQILLPEYGAPPRITQAKK